MRFQLLVLRLVAVSQPEGAEEETGGAQHIREGQLQGGFLPEGVQPCMVHRHPGSILPGGSVHNPVDQVVALVVIHRGDGPDAPAEEFDAALQGVQFLGFQAGIGQVATHGIIQLRKGGHPVGCIVGGVKPQGIGNPEIGINTGEQADALPVAGVVHGREPRRGGKPPQHDLMLQE